MASVPSCSRHAACSLSPHESPRRPGEHGVREEVTVTYNLFRSDDLDELYCAVPEHRAVPRFVKAGAWSFEGKIREEGAPKAFDGSAAKVGVRFNGFHLFQGVRFR
jgi:hypothetical protein